MRENWETRWKDYYRILQVHPSAEQEVVKAAYDKLARKYHPDLNKDAAANERMKDINEAFEVLGDLEKRRRYHSVWLQKTGISGTGPEPAKEEAPVGGPPKGGATALTVGQDWRRTGLVLALAIIPGSAGFLGIGHFHLHRLRRGFIFFLIGLPLYFLGNKLYTPLAIYLVLFLWQAYDAWRIARSPQPEG